MNSSISSHFIQVISVSLLVLLSLTNCSPPEAEIPEYLKELENLVVIQPNSEPASSIELIQEAVIDDRNATRTWFTYDFGEGYWFAGLEVDDSGRIYVGNGAGMMIQVFDSDGSYLTSIGSEGNGPGEFKGILDIGIDSNQLYAFDFLQYRTTLFSLDSFKVDEVQDVYLSRAPNVEELTGWLSNRSWLVDNNTFLVQYMDEFPNGNIGSPKYNLDKPRPGKYYIVDREGKVLSDMLFELKHNKIITADINGRHPFNIRLLPFLNQPFVSISNSGHIISANSEESLVKMYAPNGDYLRSFYIPMEKKALVRDELTNMYTDLNTRNQSLLQHAELPEKWPALGDIILDDENRLWISTIHDSEDLTYKWWVLEDTGELLATFSWPGNRSIEKIKDGYLYARETEESSGLQTIVKYRIEMD
ncbi:MAG: 6-bladed beta-propeller [Bacteroidetes bacterium]|jgi:hypothetical protein|nr:6-bladed beta-propeller [Bacteroidota bacterium]